MMYNVSAPPLQFYIFCLTAALIPLSVLLSHFHSILYHMYIIISSHNLYRDYFVLYLTKCELPSILCLSAQHQPGRPVHIGTEVNYNAV